MKKKFYEVEYQQKVRTELGRTYRDNREKFIRELNEKYGYLKETEARQRRK